MRRLAHYTTELGAPRMATILGPDYVPNTYVAACAKLSTPPPP